ncbi:hypothetical protein M409DRAFT_26225 [Zasmidium cellare ATCC 36951]|uniref:Major facilitator superfamily (MFS) profile domain-containing protein n=1 Tax=Zasmidium cellare ATCC 36951 TaxID=1080233 RepID=A0A6A6CBN7_ZASCE|nr:uncharacterized protein M409DRAFT_26225 [Zasmidium cellare ATCC 36951]KAF2163618.1 hypothetical protein M409DRAFT_26225 [Zasmidium cellare ATCC 36951]
MDSITVGTCESALTPGLILVVSMWFRRDEQPKRIAIWYTGVGASSIVGSLVSFGFQFYHSHYFASWQIMFLVFGLVTISFGIVVIVFLPDNPATARRLSPAEREAVVNRLTRDQNTIESKQWKRYQLQQCLLDPQTWLLALSATAAAIPNGAVSNFQSIVIRSLGYNNKQTALLQIPGGVIAVCSVLFAGWCASRYNARGLTAILCSTIGGLLGGGLLAFLPANEVAGRLVGNYMTHVLTAVIPCIYSFGASNTAGHTKKVTMNAILLMSNCLGNILGPLTFRNKDAPEFVPAKTTLVAVEASTILLVIVLLGHYKRQNSKREVYATDPDSEQATDGGFDRTDVENVSFRYKY